MHVDCHKTYFATLLNRHRQRLAYEGQGAVDLEAGEFSCPLCQGLSNVVVPVVPPDPARASSPPNWDLPIDSHEASTPQETPHPPVDHNRDALEAAIHAFYARTTSTRDKESFKTCLTLNDGHMMLTAWTVVANTIAQMEFASRRVTPVSEFLVNGPKDKERLSLSTLLRVSQSVPRTVATMQVEVQARATFTRALVGPTTLQLDAFAMFVRASCMWRLDGSGSLWVPLVHILLVLTVCQALAAFPLDTSTELPEGPLPLTSLHTLLRYVHARYASISWCYMDKGDSSARDPAPDSVSLSALTLEEHVQDHCLVFVRRCALFLHLCMGGPYCKYPSPDPSGRPPTEMRLMLAYLRLPSWENLFPLPSFIASRVLSWFSLSHVGGSQPCSLRILRVGPPRPFDLVQLPHSYASLWSKYAVQSCLRCGHVPEEPAVCLVCATLCCAKTRCCRAEELEPNSVITGECTRHAHACSGDVSLFLLIKQASVLLLRDGVGWYWGSIYLDAHAEEDVGMRRGRPLFLSLARYEQLRQMWVGHTLTQRRLQMRYKVNRFVF
eukprot:TRINITY_DN4169_c0_g1_i9.p1 TRINITY_DN4169_c0_g1~~TRINITY_DN4169_c0_g1_i9.p1  ORF type:complete len:624 (+),score=32.09 TRINITY_DN4169_c0_g1_i9:216-1874(+)